MPLRFFTLTFALVALTLGANNAEAAFQFDFTYSVDAYDDSPSDNGLAIQTADIYDYSNPLILNQGESSTRNLFKIWTPETTVNADDLTPQPINVDFQFTSPGTFGNAGSGATSGFVLPIFNVIFQTGVVQWDSPILLPFGTNDTGLLQITLSDTVFNPGFFGLGKKEGIVQGDFELLKAPVPEPTTIVVWGSLFAFGGVLIHQRRKQRLQS